MPFKQDTYNNHINSAGLQVDTPTVLASDCRIKGEIISTESVTIYGTVEGPISVDGTLIIGKGAFIKGDLRSNDISVEGTIKGNLTIKGHLTLKSIGKIEGDISAGNLNVEDGGLLIGAIKTSKGVEHG